MQNVALSWQQSAVLAGGVFASATALRFSRSRTGRAVYPYVREIGVIAGLYALWQLAGELSVLGTSGAFSRARWIERTQHAWGLPSEATVQHAITGHPLMVQACNLYYATMHFGVLFVFLLWLFVAHREHYGRVRATIVLVTLTSLLLQLIPVAPPRLLAGFVDTAQQYGQSVYSLGLAPDQLSAMPSLHVGWAVLIAWVVVRVSASRWRWLALLHPAATVFVVVATANHFWLDAIVAVALVALCVVIQDASARFVGKRRSQQPDETEPELARAMA